MRRISRLLRRMRTNVMMICGVCDCFDFFFFFDVVEDVNVSSSSPPSSSKKTHKSTSRLKISPCPNARNSRYSSGVTRDCPGRRTRWPGAAADGRAGGRSVFTVFFLDVDFFQDGGRFTSKIEHHGTQRALRNRTG